MAMRDCKCCGTAKDVRGMHPCRSCGAEICRECGKVGEGLCRDCRGEET